MKKRVLPFKKGTLIALLFFLYAFGLQAQTYTDVTSTYLTTYNFDSPYDYAVGATGNLATGAAGKKALSGWTITSGTNSCAGAFQYGTAATFNGASVPAAGGGYGGSAGGCFTMSNGWGETLTYTKSVSMPAGTYKLVYAANNRNTSPIASNKFGFVPTGGTAVYSSKVATSFFVQNTWVTDTVSITLTQTTTVAVSMGYTAVTGVGSGSSAKLCIDFVKILYTPDRSVLTSRISLAQTAYGTGTGVGAAALSTEITNAQAVNANATATQTDIDNAVTSLQNVLKTYLYNNVTAGSPFNLTTYIKNPSFETWQTNQTASIPNWTNTNSFLTQNNAPGQTWVKDGNMYAEKWIASGSNLSAASLSQTISGIPDGLYRLTVNAHAIQQSNTSLITTGASVFAGSSSTPVNVGGTYTVDNVAVVGGSFNIGYQLVAPITCNWTGFDSFSLYYLGPVMDPVLSAPQTTVNFTTASNTATINLTGANLTSDVSITVPSSHITLSGTNVTGTSPNYTIALANANTTNNITATWDKAANVSGNISFTSGTATKTVSVTSDDVESVALSGISISTGILSPSFAVGTTSYTTKVPANVSSIIVSATATPSNATVTNNTTTISAASPSVVLTGNSYNGVTHTSDYTINWGGYFTIDDWDANGDITSTDISKPSTYGWKCMNTTSVPYVEETVWNNFGTQSNCRYNDKITGGGYSYGGSEWTGRILYVRWDAGGTTKRVFSYPVRLEACKSYNFASKVAWNSNGSAPTVTYSINTANDNSGTNVVTPVNITTGASGALVDANISNISVPTAGVYYLTITANTNSLCAIADLSMVENTTASLSKSASSLAFTTAANEKTFTVSGNALTGDITLTPPAGITLNPSSIALADAQCGKIITATWDKAANVTGNITVSTAGLSDQTIAVTTSDVETSTLSSVVLSAGALTPSFASTTTTYTVKAPADVASVTVTGTATSDASVISNNGGSVSNGSPLTIGCTSYNGLSTTNYAFTWGGNYTFTDWAANGSTDATLSIPTVYGWSAVPTLTWVAANSTNVGTSRYMDMVSGANTGIGGITYTYNATNYDGRIMFVRWDGNLGRIYSYPVYLESGKKYKVTGKTAWNSVNTAPTLTFGINSAKDNNAGTSVATGTALTGTAGTLVDVLVNNFNITSSGIYYLNITSDTESLCAIADLAITDVTTVTSAGNASNSKMTVITNNSSLRVKDVTNYTVYTMQGMKVADIRNNTESTIVKLVPGAYVVRSSDAVQKVIVK